MRVAINGFGRIGRLVFKMLLNDPNVELVAINDLTDNKSLAHLLKYDSVHGKFVGDINADDAFIYINGKAIHAKAISEPENLPWNELNIDLVVEATGRFRTKELASKHIIAGAKKVLISAPAGAELKMIVLGINEDILTKEDALISNASCTTNCLAPMANVLDSAFGIERGYATTVHAYTADQNLQDAPHKKDLRRARAAALNIVPTSTNAGKALSVVIPEMLNKITATAIRVPVIDGSLIELNVLLNNEPTIEEINNAFKTASETNLNGILEYTNDPIVSSDIIGNSHSCVFDAQLTVVNGNFVKITSWYDNEYGYSSRLKDLINYIQKL